MNPKRTKMTTKNTDKENRWTRTWEPLLLTTVYRRGPWQIRRLETGYFRTRTIQWRAYYDGAFRGVESTLARAKEMVRLLSKEMV